MEALWKIALGVAGGSGVGALLFWSLYSQWIKIGIFSQLDANQTFLLMVMFLILAFLGLVAFVVAFKKSRPLEGRQVTQTASDGGIAVMSSGKSSVTITKTEK